MQLTTKRQLLDLYFEYDGRRVLKTDKVPYDANKMEFINLIAKTRNMVGDTLTFTAHGQGKSNVLGKLGETKVDSSGLAKITLSSFSLWDNTSIFGMQKSKAQTLYAGIEGFSAKHIKNRTLVLQVGAKWDSNTIQHSLTWGAKVSKEFRLKLLKICSELWGESRKYEMANGLMAVMNIETASKFESSKVELVIYRDSKGEIKKKYEVLSKDEIMKLNENFKGAVGLIQFTQDSIDALNTEYFLDLTKRKLALMSNIEQLDYVKKYFEYIHVWANN